CGDAALPGSAVGAGRGSRADRRDHVAGRGYVRRRTFLELRRRPVAAPPAPVAAPALVAAPGPGEEHDRDDRPPPLRHETPPRPRPYPGRRPGQGERPGGGGSIWRSWHPSAETLEIPGAFQRVPSGTLWHPLADFGTLRP